jgi:two-component system, LytTR family, response regulator
MIIKTVIIDDEPENVTMLEDAIDNIHDVEVIATFKSGEEFFKVFKKLKFDLCIIDFHLPGMDGMACAKRLGDKKIIMESPDTIPADIALELDEVVDVIRISKPMNKERLVKAVKKVRDELMSERGYIVLKAHPNNVRQLKLDDIIYIEAQGEYKNIITYYEKIKTQPYNIEVLLEKLPDSHFCRISRFEIININYFHSFTNGDSIKLSHPKHIGKEIELSVGKNYYNNFAELLGIDNNKKD